jgi:hypothetical protein
MELGINREIVDNRYYAEITTTFRESEEDLITKFGDPLINVGGEITGPPEFTLGDNTRKLSAGFPYTFYIDGASDAEAKDKMVAWIAEVRTRIISALNTLRSQSDDYTGEVLESV